MSSPVTVAQARERAKKLFDREARGWAASGDEGAALSFPLHPPTEQVALRDQGAAQTWTQAWSHAEGQFEICVQWATRSWARVGSQRVPERLAISGADAIATFAGVSRQWRTMRDRLNRLREQVGDSPEAISVLRTHARRITDLESVDFDRLLGVLDWLRMNPASGLLVRELPIRGVDSKWIGSRRALVEALHRAGTGHLTLGLGEPPPLIRMRGLDPAYRWGGLSDVTAPVAELATLEMRPRRVYVVENLQTLLAMPDLPDAVVVAGGGYGVNLIAQLPWAREVTYWGDLDSHGFGILHRLRTHGVRAQSVLMDHETLAAHRDLCGVDPDPATAVFTHLTEEEQLTLSLLSSGGNLRLEQERIPWGYALKRLRKA